jgi:hypothetical protein
MGGDSTGDRPPPGRVGEGRTAGDGSANALQERQHPLDEQLGGRLVVGSKAGLGEEVTGVGVEEQLGVGGGLDQAARRIEVAVPSLWRLEVADERYAVVAQAPRTT